jgi:pimeloyl-ACP methyl ester carboxylesterase
LSSGAVSAPDQRGYSPGARPTTIQAYRMPELVADVVAIADRLDVETFDLVGPDWGGVVAWQLAGRHPDRVATLTAVSTPASAGLFARALVAGTQALRSAYIPMLRLPRLPELLLGGHRQWGLRRLLAQDGLGADWVDTAIWALAQPGALSAALAWYRAATPFSLRFEVLAGAGHWLPEQHALELGRRLLEHLGRWSTRQGAGGPAR